MTDAHSLRAELLRLDRRQAHRCTGRSASAFAGHREGMLRPGERLASARSLASELGVARGTVEAAYGQLAGEGYLVARGQAGTVVSPQLPQRTPPPRARARRRHVSCRWRRSRRRPRLSSWAFLRSMPFRASPGRGWRHAGSRDHIADMSTATPRPRAAARSHRRLPAGLARRRLQPGAGLRHCGAPRALALVSQALLGPRERSGSRTRAFRRRARCCRAPAFAWCRCRSTSKASRRRGPAPRGRARGWRWSRPRTRRRWAIR